jgi:ribosomal protein S20
MPNTKSAERRMRGNERKHQHNRSVKSSLRGVEKDYRALLLAGKKDEAAKAAARRPFRLRQSRQIRRRNPADRQPQEIAPRRRARPREVISALPSLLVVLVIEGERSRSRTRMIRVSPAETNPIASNPISPAGISARHSGSRSRISRCGGN